MPLFVYLAVAVVALFSVALEWDTLVAPSPTTWQELQAVSHLGKPPAQHDAPPPPATAQQLQPKTAVAAPPQVNAAAPAQKTAAPLCDVAACAAAYRTFRASDCTYVPSLGERRLCTKGTPPPAVEAQAAGTVSAVPGCHVRTCAEHYSTFNPQDCTYQPLEGPRRLCEK